MGEMEMEGQTLEEVKTEQVKVMAKEAEAGQDEEENINSEVSVVFVSEAGEAPFPPFEVPKDISPEKLALVLKAFLTEEEDKNRPYLFFVNDKEPPKSVLPGQLLSEYLTASQEVTVSLAETLHYQLVDYERAVRVVYQPQAVFRVRGVARCTASLSGHGQPVVKALFSPDGRRLASGSGDKTVRLWDLETETPLVTLTGHQDYVLALAWSPDCRLLASGDRAGAVRVWDAGTGAARGRPLTGHRAWVTALAWEPLHCGRGATRRLASSSKDGDVRVWDVVAGSSVRVLTGHTASVTCLLWGGAGLLYSASQDRTIKVWRAGDGVLCRTLQGHGHWVNVLALNTEYVMRTGAFEPAEAKLVPDGAEVGAEQLQQRAEQRYQAVIKLVGEEILVSGSDDFTLFLWRPGKEKTSFARLTGHQQAVNAVQFSPDARLIASASFDKSLRVWCGRTGRHLTTLRGHVQAVYQLAWSADSRLVVSGSKDSTLKLWSVESKALHTDLPGHGDEVYTVDWSPDGQRVVSGSKDKLLRIWRH